MSKQVELCGSPERKLATPEDVADAVDALTAEDHVRLFKAAASCLGGTPYETTEELVSAAVSQTYTSAAGDPGRRWPVDVRFIAFMVNTIQGMASDSRKSAAWRRTDRVDDLLAEGDQRDPLGARGRFSQSVEDEVLEEQELRDQAARNDAVLAKIAEFYKGDDDVLAIMMQIEDGLSPKQVQEMFAMSEVKYDTARRRWRRGLAKLFPRGRET